MRLDVTGSQRQDQQQAPRGAHAPFALDLQDGGGRGQATVQQRGRRSLEIVEFPPRRDPSAAQSASIVVDVSARLVTRASGHRLSRTLQLLERLVNTYTYTYIHTHSRTRTQASTHTHTRTSRKPSRDRTVSRVFSRTGENLTASEGTDQRTTVEVADKTNGALMFVPRGSKV